MSTRISVLSLFSINLFDAIQLVISLMHDWTRDSEYIGSPVAFGLNERYNCVSSAWKWKFKPCCLTISAKGVVYVQYKTGPSTEPGGHRRDVFDCWSAYLPLWHVGCALSSKTLTKIRPFPVIPKRCASLPNSMSWSTDELNIEGRETKKISVWIGLIPIRWTDDLW